ncbi:chemotaxis protein CheW [Sphingobium boeckii]|uniref:Purine-binding chemotaxis protein CheW n=1 Tax=Sphingobium boeckii TaxID=1082345 RepID=A0A7W9EGX3_9SPHN|nr:chemotaxis protein CheW [Sphingobium boeckii]MBB5687156.1 purine-binding chemotaxis protein CheW [Sphingobium boeckii]
MKNLYLIASLSGQRIAFDVACVDSVVNVAAITPAPLAPPHVCGLAALRSRVITMIDCRTALALDSGPKPDVKRTIVVNLDGHQYGLIVDQVEDVCAIAGGTAPVRARLGKGWARAAIGMLDHEGQSILLLDPAVVVSGSVAVGA